ncbi:hypothetical protein EDB92DRAFT_1822738 [Lactarius akahatsu]|uniref:Uncharacterized protein n=1 Tax=Lactarius akahatsu TaxID=416441 RepID=A0AAD4L2Y9_9AGAM|nr:hypothetical protein EDB92DRAFT_1822738 [Lactarius akahatsu]
MSALLCANDAGELEFTGFSLYGQTPQQTASTQFPKRLPLQRINTRALIPLDPFKLLLPGPITLYRTIITFTLLAFFPCLASPPSFTSLDLTLKSEYITKLHVRQRLGDAGYAGRLNDRHRISGLHWADMHPSPSIIHPALGRARHVGARRCAQRPAGQRRDGEQRFRAVLHRGCTRCSSCRAPIPGAVIKTWETDDKGFYNTQYADHVVAYCHGQLVTDKDGKYVPLFPSLIPFPVTQFPPANRANRAMPTQLW